MEWDPSEKCAPSASACLDRQRCTVSPSTSTPTPAGFDNIIPCGTFTITNYGSAGALFDTPIVNQPEVAILGTGALVKRPVVVTNEFGEDTIAVRDMMYLSLSYDHRLTDGAVAARFLSGIKARLEEGDFAGEF